MRHYLPGAGIDSVRSGAPSFSFFLAACAFLNAAKPPLATGFFFFLQYEHQTRILSIPVMADATPYKA